MFGPGKIADNNELESLGVGIDRCAGIETPVLLLGGARSPKHLRVRLEALAAVLPNVHPAMLLKRSDLTRMSARVGGLEEQVRLVESMSHAGPFVVGCPAVA
jgi:hypothetical protein